MKISFAVFLLLTLTLLLPGCAAPTPTPIPTNTPVPTATTVLPTETSVLTVIPTKLILPNNSVIREQCPEIAPTFTPGEFTKGTLVVFPRFSNHQPFINLETGDETSIKFGSRFFVSPSRSQIFYRTIDQNTLIWSWFIATIGEVQPFKLSIPKTNWLIIRWFDDQRLAARIYKNLPVDPPPHEIVILNPFSGEIKRLVPNLPNISQQEIDWENLGPASYDQSLDYVLYAAWDDTANINMYVLYRISSGTKLAVLPGSSYSGSYLYDGQYMSVDGVSNNPPQWSFDGARVALISTAPEKQVGVDEIFALTKDGEIQRLTYFANHFDKAKINNLSWSPDSKSIAFWVTLEPPPYQLSANAYQDVRLAVLNTETLEITVYCISGDNIGLENGVPSPKFISEQIPAPIWSPDGMQIVVENRYADDNSRLILLDIPSGKAVEIGKDIEPVGWMISGLKQSR